MDSKEEVKSRLAIEDVVAEYLELQRAGRNWKAKSPFTNERTASFIVSPEKQIWHDFSSGKGGDIFTFIMEMEGIDFKAALGLLARKAGVEIEDIQNGKRHVSKNRLYEALDLAARFYQIQLKNNKLALEYLRAKRKFKSETILAWQIGYAPNNGDALIKFLIKKGFSQKEINQAGLSTYLRGNNIDIFRERIMVPLCDPQGRIIGFTARILDDKSVAPKYVNTPKTLLYDKSRHIFGLNFAKQDIRKKQYSVVCEGNLDVISSHQAGVKEVVATAGTAITESHLKSLVMLADDIRLALDSDSAGIRATEKAIINGARLKINLNVIKINGAKDPDELILNDPKAWIKAIDNFQYGLDWIIDLYQNQRDITKPHNKLVFSDQVAKVIKYIEDPVEQDHYVNIVAKLLGVSIDSIHSKLIQKDSTEKKLKRPIVQHLVNEDKTTKDQKRIQDNFLALILNRKTLREFVESLSEDMFLRNESKELFKLIQNNLQFDLKENYHDFKNILDYVKIEQLLYEELYSDLDLNELHYEASRLKIRIIESYVKSQKDKISKLIKESGQDSHELLKQAKNLDVLLNKTKEERVNYGQEK